MYHNTKQQKRIQNMREKSTELLQQIYLRTARSKEDGKILGKGGGGGWRWVEERENYFSINHTSSTIEQYGGNGKPDNNIW